MPTPESLSPDLKERFTRLVSPFASSAVAADPLWAELEKMYTARSRYYHNLTHVRHLFDLLEPFREEVEDWPALSLAVFYHDAVYNVLKSDNEARSAALAENRLRSVGLPETKLASIKKHILATQKHEAGEDTDTSLFTDADLSILGADWDDYRVYTRQIRQEYAIYPDLIYMPGREKVLKHFLAMPEIFKTPEFRARYEENARRNLKRELDGPVGA